MHMVSFYSNIHPIRQIGLNIHTHIYRLLPRKKKVPEKLVTEFELIK